MTRRRASRARCPAGRAPPRRSSTRAARRAVRRDATGSSAGASELAARAGGGGRLLAAGNGGSACQAQHLTAELVGRYRDDRAAVQRDRAVRRDLGADRDRQRLRHRGAVRPPGPRPRPRPATCWSRSRPPAARRTCSPPSRPATEARPDDLGADRPRRQPAGRACDERVCVDSPHTATVQEIHLVAIHLLCAAFDDGGAAR